MEINRPQTNNEKTAPTDKKATSAFEAAVGLT